jgi:4-aminobutyrate aminotransferase-like enzyme
MTPATRDSITAGMPKIVEGYDLDAERSRLGQIPDVVVRGQRLNRGNATVSIQGDLEGTAAAAVRAKHNEAIFPNTLAPDSPVVELGWPLSGSFVRCSAGVYLDLYLAVAQKILDPAHPRIRAALQPLIDYGMLTQREINTDDFLVSAEGCEGVRTPQELAGLAGRTVAASFPGTGAWKAFLSNSGTEAVEAGIKLAWQVRHKRFLAEHGFAKLERVAKDLGIGRIPRLDGEKSLPDPLLADYPFYMVGCWGAFHGRTLGALQFTSSKKAQRAGYPMTRRVLHIPYNGSPADLAALLDPRPIDEILAAPGGVKAVVEAGRIPRDLFAGFLAEPFQGEGGYLPGDPAWWKGIEKVVRDNGGLLCVDEVQSFGRTGTLFFSEQLGVKPDVLCTAKGMVVGLTLARADLAKHLHTGWHSNTWGGGKILDNQWAYAVLDTLLNHRDPVLGGLSHMDNCRVKGAYFAEGLRRLKERHPSLVMGHDSRGLLVGLSLKRRADVVRIGWKRGLKLLGCGPSGEVSRIRILFLADAVVRELDEALRLLDEVLAEVGGIPAA